MDINVGKNPNHKTELKKFCLGKKDGALQNTY